MKVIKSTDVSHVEKPEGTSVDYYLFNDYELHYNNQSPHTTQSWHHHEKISETIYVIDGELVVEWRENGQSFARVVKAGDLIETGQTSHTFSNNSDENVRFIVLKRIPSSVDYRETFKNDKVIDE